MRILISFLAATLLVAPLTPRAMAKEVSVEFFYETLDPYGDWIQTADYGYVWHPKDVAENWRPYTVGSWAYTDAGWTWVSDEPYGAITYHYGRWASLQDAGWVWVPDTEWAPAWVSWRRSDQYVGWAPLPPEASFKRDVGISAWADSYYDIGPSQYSFVASRDFGQPELATVVLPRQQNVVIIRDTKNITNITYSDRGIYNDGPQYDVIVRDSRTPIRRLRLERRDDVVFEGNRVRGEGMRATIAGDSLRVFAPAVGFRADVAPPRVARRVEKVEVDHGWRGVAQAPEMRARFQQDTPRPPAGLPQRPAFTRATAALGLGDTNDRSKRNLDAEGKPRGSQENGNRPQGVATDNARTPGAQEGKPGDRPRTATEKGLRPEEATPSNRKPAVTEVKPGRDPQGRPMPAEPGVRPSEDRPPGGPRPAREPAEPGAPEAPRAGKGGPPSSVPNAGRPELKPEGKPDAVPRPEGANRPGAEAPRGVKEARPEAITRPDGAARPGAEIPRGTKEARPDAERPGSREPKVTSPVGDVPRVRKEEAPEAPKRPGTAPAAVARPGAPGAPGATPAPESKGKKGDKDKDKDKGQ